MASRATDQSLGLHRSASRIAIQRRHTEEAFGRLGRPGQFQGTFAMSWASFQVCNDSGGA